MAEELSDRQKAILRSIVDHFIATGEPVASRHLAKDHGVDLSASSIRNLMSDLEDSGYLTQPHTSAGRMPTDKGYRLFVNSLMRVIPLTQDEQQSIREHLDQILEPDELLHHTAKLLGMISHHLSVVSAPHLRAGTLERLELIGVSPKKILIILTIKSGLVKTITMEVATEIPREKLEQVSACLNERVSGLTLQVIRDTFAERVWDYRDEKTGLINLFIQSADKIFDDLREREKLHIGGTQTLLEQREYEDRENARSLIELINDEDTIVDVLERDEPAPTEDGVAISIGKEHGERKLDNYSTIVTHYKVGNVSGDIGVIGTRRMNYRRVIPLLHFVARQLSSTLNKEKSNE